MVWPAFILGLAGNLHCVGMCGPIALAMPGPASLRARLPGVLVYQAGRITTYVLLGAVAGLFGQGIALAGFQQGLSLLAGAFLLLAALGLWQGEQRFAVLPPVSRALVWLRSRLARYLHTGSLSARYNLGILNGLLPCGMVYAALAGALTAGDLLSSAAFMGLFGLGTLPLMLMLSLAGGMVPQGLRKAARPIVSGITLVFALLLLLRGMDLGIPYLSPALSAPADAAQCHP